MPPQHPHRLPRLPLPPSGTMGLRQPQHLHGPPHSKRSVVRERARRPCRSHLFNSSRRRQQGGHFDRRTGSKMAETVRVPALRLNPCSAALGLRPPARIRPATNVASLLARSSRLLRASTTQQAAAVVAGAKQRTHCRSGSAVGISSQLAQAPTGERRRQLRFLSRRSLREYLPAAEKSVAEEALPLLLCRRRRAPSTGQTAFRQMQRTRQLRRARPQSLRCLRSPHSGREGVPHRSSSAIPTRQRRSRAWTSSRRRSAGSASGATARRANRFALDGRRACFRARACTISPSMRRRVSRPAPRSASTRRRWINRVSDSNSGRVRQQTRSRRRCSRLASLHRRPLTHRRSHCSMFADPDPEQASS